MIIHEAAVSYDADSLSTDGRYLWICSCGTEGYAQSLALALVDSIKHWTKS